MKKSGFFKVVNFLLAHLRYEILPHIYKEIQIGSVEKSYMRKGFLLYDEMCKYLTIYEGAVRHTDPL